MSAVVSPSSWTKPRIIAAVEAVNALLAVDPDAKRLGLHSPAEATRVDEDWLLVVVESATDGVRAYEYVERLAVLESALRDQGLEQVTLVPAVTVS
jgi:hypothetical protein